MRERYTKVELGDGAVWTNQSLSFARTVGDMLIMGEMIAKAGLLREESRGSHYRTDFPERDDEKFWKASVAKFNTQSGRCDIEFVDVKAGLIKLRPRDYGKTDDSGTKQESKKETAGAS